MGNKRGQGRIGAAQGRAQTAGPDWSVAQGVFNDMLGKIFGELDEFVRQELEGKHGYAIFGLKNAIQSHVSAAFGAIAQPAPQPVHVAENTAEEKEDNEQA